ncbi:MAG: preprotein translocase subunit SecA, partial [Bacteroidaceae bacterium]|nr:preprotein translocase subunit SecA [Bacteroidaceae bacterium]
MNHEISKTLQKKVESINIKFSIYKKFSSDDLRTAVRTIEKSISTAEDEVQALDNYLEDVFAIVKATAYLFSQGDVEVEANDYDRLLATKFDFVQIVGDKAIYLNTWEAGGEKMTWNMVHYDEQLLGGIYLHYGYATEMATGEGKTLVATLPVMLNALTHKGVHVMTVNDYLSKRDCEITRPIYMFHGLTVGCIEYYGTHSQRRKSAYKSDITFGTNSEFTFDYLFDHMSMSPEDCVQQVHNYAIVDELDSVMIDDADNPHIVSGGQKYDVGELFKKYKSVFEELFYSADASEMFVSDKLNNTAHYTQKG